MSIAHEPNGVDVNANRVSTEPIVTGTTVDSLAWFSFEPYTKLTDCRRSLQIAAELMAPGAWVVVQAHRVMDPDVLKDEGFEIVETFENQAPAEDVLSIYLARRTS